MTNKQIVIAMEIIEKNKDLFENIDKLKFIKKCNAKWDQKTTDWSSFIEQQICFLRNKKRYNIREDRIVKITPYDDADYYWAKKEKNVTHFIRKGKIYQSFDFFISDDDIVEELIVLNKNIEPKMIHN